MTPFLLLWTLLGGLAFWLVVSALLWLVAVVRAGR